MHQFLQVNAIIEWLEPDDRKGEMARVLYVDSQSGEVVLFPLPGDKDFPHVVSAEELADDLENGVAFIKPIDPYPSNKAWDEDIKPKYVKKRDKAWETIKGIALQEPDIYDCDVRGKLVVDAADRAKTYPKSIYRYLRQYWCRGKVKNALLPDYDKCGGRGKDKSTNEGVKRGRPRIIKSTPEDDGVNVTPLIKANIREVLDKVFNKTDEKPVRKCYTHFLKKYCSIGEEEDKDGNMVPIPAPAEECITIDQFRYWLKKLLGIKESIIARKGRRKFNLKHREILKESTSDAFGPGHIYQVDATIADTYLVSSLDRTKIIGRPILYFVMDVFSRMIVGFYIGLSGPNYIGAAMALENAASNKAEFCQKYGITIDLEEWPVMSFADFLVADRAELLSNQSDHLVNAFSMTILNTPSYRADLKGIVEQQFHRANEDVVHWTPGAVLKDSMARGEKDPRLSAGLTINEFTKVIIYMILNHNQSHFLEGYPLLPEMLADGVSPIPIDLWNWGLDNRMGCLKSFTKEDLITGLMPSAFATITKSGIKFKNRYYSCPRAEEEGWFVVARKSGVVKVKASYDPRQSDTIYIHSHKDNDLIECSLLEKSQKFEGQRDEDVDLYWFARAVQKRVEATRVNKGAVKLESLTQKIFEDAIAATQAAWEKNGYVSQQERVGGIRDNREEERERLNKVEAFKPLGSDNNKLKQDNEVKVPEPEEHLDDRGSMLSVLLED